jgi:drug/metabolite transporter (DMT)-like permease
MSTREHAGSCPRHRIGACLTLGHVIAILGGLGAATMWASATLTSSRAGRLIGPNSTVAWMMLVGLALATPLALVSGPMPEITPALTVWLAGSAAGSVIGLLIVYHALQFGKVGVVSALASTEGAMAAVFSVIAGERLTLPVIVVLVVLAGGVAIVALATGEVEAHLASDPEHVLAARKAQRKAVAYAAVAALAFGISIFSTAQLGKSFSPFAAVLPVRVAGVVFVTLPMALSGRLRLTRRAVPMVILIGSAEVFGNAAYVYGAGQSIAIAAVLASQFAGIAAIAAFVIFHERLTVQQRSGVVAIAIGVAALTLARGV